VCYYSAQQKQSDGVFDKFNIQLIQRGGGTGPANPGNLTGETNSRRGSVPNPAEKILEDERMCNGTQASSSEGAFSSPPNRRAAHLPQAALFITHSTGINPSPPGRHQ
jgi:hypothetical protein